MGEDAINEGSIITNDAKPLEIKKKSKKSLDSSQSKQEDANNEGGIVKDDQPLETKKKSKESLEISESNESDSTEGRTDKFYGLLKMPFKKGSKKEKIVDFDENSVELVIDMSAEEIV